MVFVDHIRPTLEKSGKWFRVVDWKLDYHLKEVEYRSDDREDEDDHVRAKSLKVHLRRTWQNVGETLFHV